MKFKDLKVGDSNIVLNALVLDCKIKQTVNQTPYYGLTITDGEESLDARIWTVSIVNNLEKKEIEVGEVYELTVKVNDYAGKNQIIITKIAEHDPTLDLSIFFKTAPIERAELEKYIDSKINSLNNLTLKNIVSTIVHKCRNAYFTHQAAVTMHHNYIGGLAHHVYSMLKIGEVLINNYPALNQDLLFSGIIIHDIGKIYEIQDGKAPTYSKEGNLLGHIVIGMNMLNEVINELGYQNSDEALSLMHMIASHHGELEFGSPKEPLIIEAVALHYIDLMDAKLAGSADFVAKTEQGEYTSQIPSLNKKSLYVPKIDK